MLMISGIKYKQSVTKWSLTKVRRRSAELYRQYQTYLGFMSVLAVRYGGEFRN
jgi:hypothetical protein